MSRAQELMKYINAQLGDGTVTMGSDKRFEVDYIPTGLLPIDDALGGGIPRGRFIEITGNYSTLKSYIGYHAIAQCQKAGGVAVLVDTEHSFDPDWAKTCGISVHNLILIQPPTGEEGIDAAELMTVNGVDLIVFDSLAALLPQAEKNKRLSRENIQPGQHGKLMSAACRRLTAVNRRTAFVWINQLREQIGVSFGPTEKATGGRAMGYYASARLNIRKIGNITVNQKVFNGEKEVDTKILMAQQFKLTLEKSKLGRPWREWFFEFNLEMGGEIDIVKYCFARAYELGIISKKGNTWSYGKVSVVGKEKFLQRLRDDPTLPQTLDQKVRETLDSLEQRGRSETASKKAAALKGKSSGHGAQGRTRTAARAASRTTAARRKRSLK